ncbi:alpha-(1,3)-fucosyltransferase C-like [Toxorhynchites rutilus septentrionalis]|uniref:alpha-(1,3)-fucosyltransferase C-like n=1 Tax=Toxorhynchites rutilus septentrionalis TaxID=329112 RepID=UPI0024794CDB|nr:alpha-(1,3)-fucosyltransferase C-like [Toxorhynchites rutilus septentrionalis]
MIRKMRRGRLTLCLAFGFITLVIATALLIHTQCLKPSISYYQILEEHIQNHKPITEKRTKYILLYTNFFEDKLWKLPTETVGPDYFRATQCPRTDCVLTSNHDLLPVVTDYDALVFHIAEPWAYSVFRKVPSVRSSRQIFVAATMESPAHTKHLLGGDHDFFNWTMTYRLDSDIVWNYNNFVERDSGRVVRPGKDLQSQMVGHEVVFNQTLLEMATVKTKMGVQFISHCETFSRRDDLVRAIQRFMEVDVYGKCGTMECPRDSPRCAKMLTDEYRYYFAFENSLCKDYVTEKMYYAMQSFIIPVVFGGADYTKFVPPKSYIDAQQFATVQDLVEYLVFLAENPEHYIKYFWWKDHYRIADTQPFCELCQKLHDIGTKEKMQYYKDIKAWWFDEACWMDAKIKF